MKYELGEKLYSFNEYLNHCMVFSEFQNNIMCGDKFWKTYHNEVTEFEFVKFVYCEWQGKYGQNSDVCDRCKGKIEIKGSKFLVCSGAGKKKSNILKIIKNYGLLEDDLFDI